MRMDRELFKPDTVVFDLGGVLIDLDVPRCVRHFRRVMSASCIRDVLGIDDEGEGVVAVSAATRQLMRDYEHGRISTAAFLDNLRSCCHAGTTDEDLREAWHSMLGELPPERLDYIAGLRKSGYRTILLSNTNELHWNWIMERYGLPQYFDALYASHLLHMAKPDKSIFEHVSRASCIVPSRTVYVDDLAKNCAAGELYAGWVTCGSIEELQGLLP